MTSARIRSDEVAPARSLYCRTIASSAPGRFVADERTHILLDQFRDTASVTASMAAGRDRAALLATERQLPTMMAALMLHGLAGRLYFCTPDLFPRLEEICSQAEIDVVITDEA